MASCAREDSAQIGGENGFYVNLRTTVTSIDCPAWTLIGVVRACDVIANVVDSAWPEQAAGPTDLAHAPRFVATFEMAPAAAAFAVPDKVIEKTLAPELGDWTVRFGKM